MGAQKKPDFVVAADSGLESLRSWQAHYEALGFDFSPDAILGDFDSLGEKKILDEYDESLVERSTPHKDLTDTEMALFKALSLAQAKEKPRRFFLRFSRAPQVKEITNEKAKSARGGRPIIALIGGGGTKRADHFLGIYNLFGTKIAPDAWLCGEQVFYRAERSSFSISGLKEGDIISVARTAQKNRGGKIRSQGLEWESPLFRKVGMPSISNTIKKEWARQGLPVKIEFLRGSFVLIAPLSASVLLDERSKGK